MDAGPDGQHHQHHWGPFLHLGTSLNRLEVMQSGFALTWGQDETGGNFSKRSAFNADFRSFKNACEFESEWSGNW